MNVTTLPIVTPIYVSDTHQSLVPYPFTVRTLPSSVADLHKTDKKFHGKSSRVYIMGVRALEVWAGRVKADKNHHRAQKTKGDKMLEVLPNARARCEGPW